MYINFCIYALYLFSFYFLFLWIISGNKDIYCEMTLSLSHFDSQHYTAVEYTMSCEVDTGFKLRC